jgi:hypothetical protein
MRLRWLNVRTLLFIDKSSVLLDQRCKKAPEGEFEPWTMT